MCTAFSITAAFVLSVFAVVGAVIARIIVVKFLNDVTVGPSGSTEGEGEVSQSSSYEAPAAVDSESNPEVSAVEPSAIV